MYSKRVRRLWLEMNDKDLFKSLRDGKLETQLDNAQRVLEKKENLRVLIMKS